jgi:hypothetical protein
VKNSEVGDRDYLGSKGHFGYAKGLVGNDNSVRLYRMEKS